MPFSLIQVERGILRTSRLALLAVLLTAGGPAFATLIFNPTFDDAGMLAAGLTAGQVSSVHTAFTAATAQLANNFNDSIHVNINVKAVAGTGTLGQSNTFLNSFSFASILSSLGLDAKSGDDATAIGPGGSATGSDPVGTSHNWWVSTAQAKALGLIPDNAVTIDGTFTFGAGFSYDFDPTNGVTGIDFQGVVMHEVTEIMGRIAGLGGSIGGTPGYMLYDLFRYLGVGARGLTNGGGIDFSINGGTTLLKAFNNESANGGDAADWASGTNDSFNAFSSGDVVNGLSAVDLRAMDVIGYDSVVPEPATGFLVLSALAAGGVLRRRIVSRRARF